jgi:hypothetical protein
MVSIFWPLQGNCYWYRSQQFAALKSPLYCGKDRHLKEF